MLMNVQQIMEAAVTFALTPLVATIVGVAMGIICPSTMFLFTIELWHHPNAQQEVYEERGRQEKVNEAKVKVTLQQ